MKTTVQIMYWHDIPIQVKAKKGRARLSKELSERFQIAIDRAAMAAGLVGSEAYTEQFYWTEPVVKNGELEEVVEAVASDLERRFEQIDWQKTARLLKEKQA